jgi:itaconyl-CoA hydratase
MEVKFVMALKQGWQGRTYEDFEMGDIYQHPLGRTITPTDNIWFTLLTVNSNPVHFDHFYAAHTEFKRPLVNSTLTLAVVTALSVSDISQNAINLGWDEIRLPNPVFNDDTLYAQSEVIEMRLSRSRPNMGIIKVKTIGLNQDGQIVIEFKRTIMAYRRGHVPQRSRPLEMP